MNTTPIVAAQWATREVHGTAQAGHALLAGNGLPARWRGRDRFTILETGFGSGNNFLATLAAWRADAQRCSRLHFVSIEATPFERSAMASIEREPALAPLAAMLLAAWPPLTCNLHRLSFEDGAVELLLAFGDVAAWLPQLSLEADAFFLEGHAPTGSPAAWAPRVFKAMGRVAATDATVAAWTAARSLQAGLLQAGFETEPAFDQKGGRQSVVGHYAPRFVRRGSTRRSDPAARHPADEPVVVVGGGLAGCAVASALAEAGLSSVVFERNAHVAQEASGNVAGLFHGVVHAEDGRHARFFRAAALAARAEVAAALGSGVPGSVEGLLRLEFVESEAAMRTVAAGLGLPIDYARVVDAAEAGALAGTALHAPGWFFASGGWVDPRALCSWWLERAGTRATVRTGGSVASLRRDAGRWLLVDAGEQVLASAATVVLADGGGSLSFPDRPLWPVARVRGQLSSSPMAGWPTEHVPRMPVTGAGYVLAPIEGAIWFGATTRLDDGDAATCDGDHRANMERVRRLLSINEPMAAPAHGRSGLRWLADDRLPIVGSIPNMAAVADASGTTFDRPRLVPRLPGLYAICALGSRGIASAALGARVIASAISGGPSPIEADLLDAIDPARFVSRGVRRAAAASAGARARKDMTANPLQAVPGPAGSAGD